jgi:hypothetical protein
MTQWRLEIDNDDDDPKKCVNAPIMAWVWDGENSVICRPIRDERDRKNMRLITASPRLLEACKLQISFLRTLRDNYPDLWDQIVNISSVTAWDELKTAIREAEAES